MNFSTKWLERLLFAVGAALCLFYLGVIAYRSASSRMAVRSFEAAKETVPTPPPPTVSVALPTADIDFRLWAAKRIAAYQDSLSRQFAPPLAVLRIPRLAIEVPVFEGTDELVLNRGVGRIPGTARLGDAGNLGVAGHRDGFFRGLKNIAVGDSLMLDTGAATDVYVVEQITIVDRSDVTVLAPTSSPSMTLVTCYPFYFVGDAPRRYIVRCARTERRSAAQAGSP